MHTNITANNDAGGKKIEQRKQRKENTRQREQESICSRTKVQPVFQYF